MTDPNSDAEDALAVAYDVVTKALRDPTFKQLLDAARDQVVGQSPDERQAGSVRMVLVAARIAQAAGVELSTFGKAVRTLMAALEAVDLEAQIHAAQETPLDGSIH